MFIIKLNYVKIKLNCVCVEYGGLCLGVLLMARAPAFPSRRGRAQAPLPNPPVPLSMAGWSSPVSIYSVTQLAKPPTRLNPNYA